MDEIGGEPAIGECRAVGATQNDGAGFPQIVDHGIIALRDGVALQLEPVGGGKAFLVDIDLHRDRHAAEGTCVFAAPAPPDEPPGVMPGSRGFLYRHE